MTVIKVVLYGIGTGCNRVMRELKDSFEIVAFADTMRAGDMFRGRVVVSPDELLDLSFDYVLVCSQAFHEIYVDLTDRLGMSAKKILNALQFVVHHPERIEFDRSAIITGMSYSWGLDENTIEASNLSAPSQDFLADLCWIEKYMQVSNSMPRIAVIGIAYYSFDFNLFKTNLSIPSKGNIGIINRMSSVADHLHVHEPENYQRFKGGMNDLQDDLDILNRLFSIKKGKGDAKTQIIGSGLAEKRKQLAERHALTFPETERRNIGILGKILSLLDQQEIQTVFFVSPQHEEYRPHYPAENITRFYRILNQLRPGAKILDFYSDDRFSNRHFADSDHLNDEGNAKLIELIKEGIFD